MRFDEFTFIGLDRGKVQVMFTEPVVDEWELSLFMNYFRKHKKKIYVDYTIKPKVSIKGLVCHRKTLDAFLRHIQRSETAEAFQDAVWEFKNVEEVEGYLKDLQEAGVRERERMIAEGMRCSTKPRILSNESKSKGN